MVFFQVRERRVALWTSHTDTPTIDDWLSLYTTIVELFLVLKGCKAYTGITSEYSVTSSPYGSVR